MRRPRAIHTLQSLDLSLSSARSLSLTLVPSRYAYTNTNACNISGSQPLHSMASVSVLEVMLSILITSHFLVCCVVVCNSYFSSVRSYSFLARPLPSFSLHMYKNCNYNMILKWMRWMRKKKDWFSTWKKKWTKLLIESVGQGECLCIQKRRAWSRRRRRTESISIKLHSFLLIAHMFIFIVHILLLRRTYSMLHCNTE